MISFWVPCTVSAAMKIFALLEEYYQELYEIARLNLFDSMAHITYPIRYMNGKHHLGVDLSRMDDLIDLTLRTLAQNGRALEINTSGLRGPIGETSPTLKYVKRFCELGGEYVTLGSDAHAAEDLGEGIQQAMELACQAGFSYFTFYKKRQPRLLQIY